MQTQYQPSDKSLQDRLFDRIVTLFPNKTEAAKDLMQLLNLGKTSVYRKMSGISTLKQDQVFQIIRHYDLSLDDLIHQQTEVYLFAHSQRVEDFRVGEGVTTATPFLKFINKLKAATESKLYYAGIDIPTPYLMYVPELIYFKEQMWAHQKNNQLFDYEPFDFSQIRPEDMARYKATTDFYEQFSTTELWEITGISVILEQIRHYYWVGILRLEDVMMLLKKIDKLLNKLERMIAVGSKTLDPNRKDLEVYYNPIPSINWFYLAESNTINYVHALFDTPNSVITADPFLFKEAKIRFKGQQQQSYIISVAGPVQRNQLFSTYRKQLKRLKAEIEFEQM